VLKKPMAPCLPNRGVNSAFSPPIPFPLLFWPVDDIDNCVIGW